MVNKDEKEINTGQLNIVGNIIKFEESLIQIRNISYITIMKLEMEKIPLWTIVLILLGIIGTGNSEYRIVSLFVIIISGLYLYLGWYRKNKERSKISVLTIVMNSGSNLSFVVRDKEFLKRILNVLEKIVVDNGIDKNSEVSINIKDCSFSGDSKVLNNLGIGQ